MDGAYYPWMGDPGMTALPKGWLTIAQAAVYFGVSRATIERRIAAGDWPTSILPGMTKPRFSPADIATIEQAAQPGPSVQSDAAFEAWWRNRQVTA